MNFSYTRYYVYVKPVFKNPIVKNYSSLIFSLIAVTFFSLFALRPTLKTIVTLQKDIDQQKLVLDQINQKSNNLDSAIKNYQAIDQTIKNRLDVLVPTKIAAPNLIEDLTSIALVYNASISAIQFQPFEVDNTAKSPIAESDLKEVPITFSASGSYFSLTSFLNSLKYTKYLINVETVTFSKTESGLNMVVSAKTVY